MVDQVFEPMLRRNLEVLNLHLADRKIRAGIQVYWFFDRFEEKDD
jgi:hypothetical protein